MLRFVVSNQRQRQEFDHLGGPIEFGRGGQRGDVPRFVIQDMYVSKDHVHVVELPGGRVHVKNLSQRNSIRLPDHSLIQTMDERDLDLPVLLMVGETHLQLEQVLDEEQGQLQTIASPAGSGFYPGEHKPKPKHLSELGKSPSPEVLTQWFETVIAVQRAAAASSAFYEETAKAVVSLVGLDRGLVVLRPEGRWMVRARYPDEDSYRREFSLTILERVEREQRTFFQSAASMPATTESLQGIEAVVASPIFDAGEKVVGVLYGSRTRFNPQSGMGIGELEAQVMQLLAAAVGVGIARQVQEEHAGRLRVQFEQFFSANLARELENNPRMLEGQEREVTVMFCDIRGFSRLSQKMDARNTCQLVQDIMEHITRRIRDHDGVVVDYAGDGVMAVWNAPFSQVDHADRACQAALEMLRDLPTLSNKWEAKLDTPLRLGIGINTGEALCGNVGSQIKFKYGPLGHAVNLGSRVEGATKHLGVPLLISGSTREKISSRFATRRLCKAKLVGMNSPIELYELHGENASEIWLDQRSLYEEGLKMYEAGDVSGACRFLSPLLAKQQEPDFPTLNLLGLAIKAMREPTPPNFDGVIDFSHSKG